MRAHSARLARLRVETSPKLPPFHLAYVGVAGTNSFKGLLGLIPTLDSYKGAREAARTALEQIPKLAGAHSTWAFI